MSLLDEIPFLHDDLVLPRQAAFQSQAAPVQQPVGAGIVSFPHYVATATKSQPVLVAHIHLDIQHDASPLPSYSKGPEQRDKEDSPYMSNQQLLEVP